MLAHTERVGAVMNDFVREYFKNQSEWLNLTSNYYCLVNL